MPRRPEGAVKSKRRLKKHSDLALVIGSMVVLVSLFFVAVVYFFPLALGDVLGSSVLEIRMTSVARIFIVFVVGS